MKNPINRRDTLFGSLALSLGASLSGCSAPSSDILPSAAKLSPRPNFLFLPIDDLNDWIGVLGTNDDVKTPNIDALANQGVLFENAYAQAPICGPSRASLMSGLYPHQTGIYGQVADSSLRDAIGAISGANFMTEYLRDNGYYAAGRGKIFHNAAPEGTFDDFAREGEFGPKPPNRMAWDSNRTHTDWGPFPETDSEMLDYKTARWGEEWLSQKRDYPFFLGLGMVRPHAPWHVPQKWFDMYPLEDITLPPWLEDDANDLPERAKSLTDVPQMPSIEWAIENNEWRPILQAYLASITFVDHCIGIAVDALARSEYADNTYIILFSDNGYHLGEKSRFAKMSLWERSTRIPLIVTGPGISPKRIDAPVGLIDLYPTIIELSGLPRKPENAGHSLLPFLTGDGEVRDPVTSVYGKDNFAVSDGRYKYIRYDNGEEELYDLQSDPHEWTNVAGDLEYRKDRDRLAAFIPFQTQDPIIVDPNSTRIKPK